MTLTLELAPEQEAKLRERAEALGLTPDGYLKRLAGLDEGVPAQDDAQGREETEGIAQEGEPYYNPAFAGKTLADVLAGRIGTQHSGRGDLSQNTGKAFTDILVEKREKGRM